MRLPLAISGDDRSVEVIDHVRSDGSIKRSLQEVRRASSSSPARSSLVLALRPAPEFHSYSNAGSKPVKDTFKPAEGEDGGALRLDKHPQFQHLPQQLPMIHQNYLPQQGHSNQMPQQAYGDPNSFAPANYSRNQPHITMPERGRMGRTRFRVPQRRRSHHRRRSPHQQYYSSGESGRSDSPRIGYPEQEDEWDYKPKMLTSGAHHDDDGDWDYFKDHKKQSPMINDGGWTPPRQKRQYAYR